MSSTSNGTPNAVPLPQRPRDSEPAPNKAPVWPIDHSETDALIPVSAKCHAHGQPGGVCCKELKDSERHLIDPDVIRDV
jgi:vacuolar iron transporter family protein